MLDVVMIFGYIWYSDEGDKHVVMLPGVSNSPR